ncbi:hypothetical protein GOFOIKOB_5178 [Methylobacterium tardum]|uniref:Integrase catalytic domain-containing protein n=1 Tax=Methylobacterium tardum TaxID=374432 RepID=A0AA37WSD7_9HYPH|nr:Mu transposase C-terminal domain-containing protein [Methylobacterium tardum]URD38093.1 Mu transposase C-terminal domain-containing protein [Methylobacterium tardum]GJE52110.1 hypothetical protein GOFOIKOB_5178 [Methylobacterium tardum]GLS71665.1 hypothetical protein GCM10007890_36780 [Methylobacterium tardum]
MIPATDPNGAPLRIGPHDAVSIDGVAFRKVGDSPDGHVFQNTLTGLHEGFGHAQLAALSMAGRVEFKANAFGAISVRTQMTAGATAFADLPLDHQKKVAWYLEWITEFLKWEAAWYAENADKPRRERSGPEPRSNAGIAQALEKIGQTIQARADARTRPPGKDGEPAQPRKPRAGSPAAGYNGPSVETFKTHLENYEAAGRNALALRPKTNRCGNRKPRFHPEVERILQEYAAQYAAEHKRSKALCHRKMRAALNALNDARVADGLAPYPVPSDKTLARRIDALDMFLVEAKRLGVDRATRKHRFIQGQAEAIRPGQRIEMDEWKLDLFFLLSQTDLLADLSDEQLADLKKRRWFLCVAIDVATRCIVGMRVDQTASVRNALSTLEMVVSDKAHLAAAAGALSSWQHMALRPEDVVTDSGGSFIAEDFHLAVIGLGSTHDIPPAGLPHLRGTIERLFKTLSLQLVREFTGQAFSNKVERGDYPAQERASITVEQFVLLAVRYALDIYHLTPHAGLGGETPADAWTRLTGHYGILPVPGRNERRSVFGLRLTRTLGRHGLQIMGLDYRADVLQVLYLKRGKIQVDIRLDPLDIGAISVAIDGTWHEARAATSGFDGVRLADHRALCEMLAKRFADQAALTQPIVNEALRTIGARATAAEKAAHFLTRFAEPEDIARAERSLRDFTIPTDADFAGRTAANPLDGVIPTGGAPYVGPPDTPPPAVPERRPNRSRPRPAQPDAGSTPPRKPPIVDLED